MKHIETPKKLLEEYSLAMGIPKKLLIMQCRERKILQLRQLFCYVGVTYYKFTLKQIGDCLGGRDHGTIINARERIKELISIKEHTTIENLKQIIEHLELPEHTGAYALLESKFKQSEKQISELKFEIKDLKIKLKGYLSTHKIPLSLS